VLKNLFRRTAAAPQNRVRSFDLHFILGCWAPEGRTQTESAGDPKGDYSTFTFSNCLDGKTFTFDALVRQGGTEYKTALVAEKLDGGLYEVKSLTFDNKAEDLKSHGEILSVFEYLGRMHVGRTHQGFAARPHPDKGRFGRAGRFMSRHFSA
jgi:hypothetical protein